LLHRIDEMVREHSRSIAIKDGYGKVLTYAQMAHRIDTVATALDGAGVTEGSKVSVFQQPASDWICSMLAIMRLGAIYIPLDRRLGLPRLAGIMKACQPVAILVDSETSEDARSLGSHDVGVINVALLKTLETGTIPNRAQYDQAGIILFTSGTTGIPKGIVLTHSNLRNQLEGTTKVYNIGKEVILQQTAFTFDWSIDEVFLALCNGGTLFVVDKARRGDSQAIMKIIASEGITYTSATPPEYSSWIRHGAAHVAGNSTWKTAFCGGDLLTNTIVQEFRILDLPQLRLYNAYGPAEITLSALRVAVPFTSNRSSNEPIPIGVPMPNYSIYILDENMKLLPPGVPGEIAVGGAGVSLGYLNQAELTNEKFLNDPWAPPEYVQNGRTKMYRTGDKGRLTKNGLVLFHGRIEGDTQIKLRGIRIELGDIESTILTAANGALSDVICTLRGDPEFLVAHAVFSPDFSTAAAEDRNMFLTQLLARVPLPDYMKPAVIHPLESMPLTVHLKRDRRAIAAISISEYFKSDELDSELGQLTELESKVKHIWQELLPEKGSLVSFSRSTDFFRVGGNSLLLVEVQAMIRNVFDVTVTLLELLEANTLGKMALKIQEASLLGEIDWNLETLPPDIALLAKANSKPLKSKDMEVLLTGATGHLGRHLLPLFVADDNIAKIHCVGIRNPSKLSATSKKIVIHAGDLTESSLGLSAASFASLACRVDAIVHCAAKRSFWEPYRSLRKYNVHPTKELIVLAGERKVPIHFLSSGGIATGSAASASSFIPSAHGSEGYLASKWVSERMLERASTDLNVPVHIYRTTSVVTETCNLPEALLDDFAHFSVAAKALPEHAAWKGTFDLLRADDVARRVYASITGNTGDDDARRSPMYVHFPAVARMGSAEQLEMLLARPEIKAAGLESFEKLPVHQWVGKLKTVGFGWMVAAQDAVLDGKLKSRR
jgi:hybrid polyketide synthase / nonribosomal peptide synthetase ACE1